MSNYTITTDFGAKDSLPSGDSNKVIKGSEFTTEFTNIQTAIATKADTSGASFTGAVTLSDSLTTTANINLGNSDKLVFGNTGQLQIYTDGTDSFITESGSGSLKIKGNFLQLLSPDDELFFTGVADGSVSLFYNGSAHLATRLNGVSVYGGFDVDTDTLYVDDTNDRVGIGTTSPAQPLHIVDATDTTVIFESTDFNSRLELRDSSGSAFVENRGGILNLKSDTADAVVNSRIEFTVDNDEKMRIEATGNVDIANGTLNIGGDGSSINFTGTTGSNFITAKQGLKIDIDSDANQGATIFAVTSNNGANNVLNVKEDGDISFYEDTGATAKLFWDASEESLGIGTTSPSNPFHVYHATTNIVGMLESGDTTCGIDLKDSAATGRITNTSGKLSIQADTGAEGADSRIDFNVDGSEKMRINSSGNVGIGTTNPTHELTVGDANAETTIGVAGNRSQFGFKNDLAIVQGGSGKGIQFNVNNNTFGSGEAMRIASSGNVGIGTTSPATALDVTGTITANGLSVESSAPSPEITIHDTDTTYGFVLSQFNSGDGILKTNNTERVRITNAGKVGIGTSNPLADLHVSNGTNSDSTPVEFMIGGTANSVRTGSIVKGTTSGAYDLTLQTSNHATANQPLIIKLSDATEAMRIDASGNVGIGTTNPTHELTVGDANAETTIGVAGNRSQFGFKTDLAVVQGGSGKGIQFNVNNNTFGSGEAMRIDSSGNLLVGKSTDDNDENGLVVNSNGYTKIVRTSGTANANSVLMLNRQSTDGSIVELRKDDAVVGSIGTDSGGITFASGGSTEKMRIDASGNLLVGKTASTFNNTAGIGQFPDGRIYITRDGGNCLYLNRTTDNGPVAAFYRGNTASSVGTISVTASATSYNTSSDERLKENIADSADAGSKIDAIQIRQFDWKADGSHQDYGVIAQELVEVAPEAVHQPEDSEDMMGVDYSKLVPMLIKEVQTLRNRVAQLENN